MKNLIKTIILIITSILLILVSGVNNSNINRSRYAITPIKAYHICENKCTTPFFWRMVTGVPNGPYYCLCTNINYRINRKGIYKIKNRENIILY